MAEIQGVQGVQGVVDHYGTGDLVGRAEEALVQAGLGSERLSWQALAPLDQFHVRGAAATAELADRRALAPGIRVLDVGCGLGGPSRQLAGVYGVDVTGVDLNPSYVALADMLTQRAGLSARVRHRQADALALPFAPGSFEVAWTQHVAMNIADRPALYAEIRRVLVPGGELAIYDVIAGRSRGLHFPLPWARRAETSFVVTEEAMREALEGANFAIASWVDATDAGISWFAEQAKAREAGTAAPPRLLAIAMGPEFPEMVANLGRNLSEGRARLVQAILRCRS